MHPAVELAGDVHDEIRIATNKALQDMRTNGRPSSYETRRCKDFVVSVDIRFVSQKDAEDSTEVFDSRLNDDDLKFLLSIEGRQSPPPDEVAA